MRVVPAGAAGPRRLRNQRVVITTVRVIEKARDTAARTRPALRANADRLRAGTTQLAYAVLAAWGWSGAALTVQATHLAALVDGLVVQLLLQPGRRQQAIATDALTEHLRALHQQP